MPFIGKARTMLLELNLMKKGLVTVDQMIAAVKRQQLGRPPLGRLAIEQGKLSMAQVFAVLKQQAGDPRPFGQIAVEMNLLDREELNQLLYQQAGVAPPLSDVLVELGYVSRAYVEAESSSIRRQLLKLSEMFDHEECFSA